MSIEAVIGIVTVIVTITMALAGWIVRRVSTIGADIASLRTEVAVIRSELHPAGGRSLSERVTAVERDVAIIRASMGANQ